MKSKCVFIAFISSVTLLMGFTMPNIVKSWPSSCSGYILCLHTLSLATGVMQEGCHHHHVRTFYQEFHQGFFHQVLCLIFPELWKPLTPFSQSRMFFFLHENSDVPVLLASWMHPLRNQVLNPQDHLYMQFFHRKVRRDEEMEAFSPHPPA